MTAPMLAALAVCREFAESDGKVAAYHLESTGLQTLRALKMRGFLSYSIYFELAPTRRTFNGLPITLTDIRLTDQEHHP